MKEAATALCETDGRVVACDAEFDEVWRGYGGAGAAKLTSLAEHPAGIELRRHLTAFVSEGRDEAHFSLRACGRELCVRLRRLGARGEPRVLVEVAPSDEGGRRQDADVKMLRLLHDFKNHLGGLKLYAAFLRKRFADDPDGVEVCEKLIRGLNAMAERAKLVARLAQPLALAPSEADLLPLVRQAAQDLNALAAERGVRIEFDFSEALPPLLLDAAHVRQAIQAALRRALCISPAGSRVCVSVRAEPSWVYIEIRDAGEAVAASRQESFFDFGAEAASQDGVEPRELRAEIALQLALARRIVEQHGGYVAAAAAPGGGTAVRIYLPEAVREV